MVDFWWQGQSKNRHKTNSDLRLFGEVDWHLKTLSLINKAKNIIFHERIPSCDAY